MVALNDEQATSYMKKRLMGLKKGKFKRETDSLLIASQNNAIRTNHIKARVDKMQQNSS